jgi:putative SOS response-associated peptidase YedK
MAEHRPLFFFPGIYVNGWTSVRKVKDGVTTNNLFAFLTTEPNADISPYHPRAMPVIFRTSEECDQWMTAPLAEAVELQRPLPDGVLRIVARGTPTDGDGEQSPVMEPEARLL